MQTNLIQCIWLLYDFTLALIEVLVSLSMFVVRKYCNPRVIIINMWAVNQYIVIILTFFVFQLELPN